MRHFTILFLVMFANVLLAAKPDYDLATQYRIKESAVDFFEKEDLIEITVKADFTAIKADRDRTKNEYHPAEIVWNDQGQDVSIPFKLKTRGNFRLDCDNCDFPPLRFKFKTSQTLNTVFEGQKKLKLVTHCRDTSEVMQNAILREYLVYKMYNSISDYSLRVRLVKVNYEDVISGDNLEKYAFFIEDIDQLAERTSSEEIEMANLTQDQVKQQSMSQLALFNYMIGNTDWSVPKLHNVALLRTSRHEPPVVVPYDFDMSEFVGACYMKKYMEAELNESRYKGRKVSMDVLEESIENYEELKKSLTSTVLNFEQLPLECRQGCLNIINSFYDTIESKPAARKAFMAHAIK